jgi:aryl-alcohol dehydrogenase
VFGRTITGFVEANSISDLFISQMIDLYSDGCFPVDRLVTYYELDQINQAIEDTENESATKALRGNK